MRLRDVKNFNLISHGMGKKWKSCFSRSCNKAPCEASPGVKSGPPAAARTGPTPEAPTAPGRAPGRSRGSSTERPGRWHQALRGDLRLCWEKSRSGWCCPLPVLQGQGWPGERWQVRECGSSSGARTWVLSRTWGWPAGPLGRTPVMTSLGSLMNTPRTTETRAVGRSRPGPQSSLCKPPRAQGAEGSPWRVLRPWRELLSRTACPISPPPRLQNRTLAQRRKQNRCLAEAGPRTSFPTMFLLASD